MAGSARSSPLSSSSLAYRTGFYVGALHGYQIVSEVSPVDGPEFCQGFASGMEVVFSWVKQYLLDGGSFDGAQGELMPYFPTLRAWVGGSDGHTEVRPIKPPGRRERQRRQWEQEIVSAISDDRWLTSREIANRLNGRGPRSLPTLTALLGELETLGKVERSRSVDLVKPRSRVDRWRLAEDRDSAKESSGA